MADEEYKKVFSGKYESYMKYSLGPNDKILAGLCYIACLFNIIGLVGIILILLLVKPQSPFLRFHAIQSLSLSIIKLILGFLIGFLSYFLIGFCLIPFAAILWIYILVIAIIIFTGSDHRVPWLANYVEENYI